MGGKNASKECQMPRKKKPSAEAAVRDIRRRTRRRFSAEGKIRIVLEGLRGEQSVSELCRRENALLLAAFVMAVPARSVARAGGR